MNKKSKIIILSLAAALALSVGFSVGVYFRSFDEKSGNTVAFAQGASSSIPIVDGMPSFRGVASKVLPTVVQVDTVQVTKRKVAKSFNPFEGFDLFDFFGQGNSKNQKDNDKNKKDDDVMEFRNSGLGSGVIIKNDGNTYYVLTNNHVVGTADEISVVLNDESHFNCKLVGKDPRKDLALISFECKDRKLPVIEIGDSSTLEVGDFVLAVGSPFGFSSTVTMGIVSALGRKGPNNDTLVDYIQTDAAINSGNSGGALVNTKGELVGINTWIATKTGESAGLGFSIAINEAQKVIDDFIKYGEVEYGWLGVTISDVKEGDIASFGLKDNKGAFVVNLFVSSPADKDGLKAGDFITAIDGKAVTNSDAIVKAVAYFRPGQKVKFSLIRNSKPMEVTVKIAKRESDEKINSDKTELWPGIIVNTITKEIADYLKLPKDAKGIVITGMDRSSKASKGLKEGDIIISINDKKINTLADFYYAFSNNSEKYMIEYKRGEETSFFGFRK